MLRSAQPQSLRRSGAVLIWTAWAGRSAGFLTIDRGRDSAHLLLGFGASRPGTAALFSQVAWPMAPGGELTATASGSRIFAAQKQLRRTGIYPGQRDCWCAASVGVPRLDDPRLETGRLWGAATRKVRNRPHRAESGWPEYWRASKRAWKTTGGNRRWGPRSRAAACGDCRMYSPLPSERAGSARTISGRHGAKSPTW